MYTPEEACQLAEAAILLSGGNPLPDWVKELNRKVAYGKITGDQACEEIKRRLSMPNMKDEKAQEYEDHFRELNSTMLRVNEIRNEERSDEQS